MMKYPASYARMRGLKGNLLGKAQLEDFLNASDADSITSALGQTAYGEYIRDSSDLSRVEHGLKQDLAVAYMKILTFLRGRSARFVEALLGKFELLNLKSIIRSFVYSPTQFPPLAKSPQPPLQRGSDSVSALQRGGSSVSPSQSGSKGVAQPGERGEEGGFAKDSAEPFFFSLGRYHTIPIEEAMESDDLESCIALMESTPFARALEIGYQQYESEGELFPLELALDLNYYERLWDALDALGPLDKYNAGRLMGIQYDITNLVWILRFREYYGLSPEQIFQYIIPHGWKIRGKVFWEVTANGDVTRELIARQVSPYDELLRSVSRVDDSIILGVELRLLRYLYRESLGIFMKFPLQAAQLIAFFICKEMEIRDIITIMSGKHLGLSRERINSYMITL